MQEFHLSWATEYATGDTEIDRNYQKILDAGLLLYQYIQYKNQGLTKMVQLATSIGETILYQMSLEESVISTLSPSKLKKHRADHLKYIEKFDLLHRYDVSDKMRVIMTAKMIKTYMGEHFFNFDIPDLRDIKDDFEGFGKMAS